MKTVLNAVLLLRLWVRLRAAFLFSSVGSNKNKAKTQLLLASNFKTTKWLKKNPKQGVLTQYSLLLLAVNNFPPASVFL